MEGLAFRVIDAGPPGVAPRGPADPLRKAPAFGMSLDETSSDATVEAIWRCFGGSFKFDEVRAGNSGALPAALRRTSPYLTHPVFHLHRSETEMLRYLRRLSDRDLALDRCMIPLGSCTMKLNATAEMIPMTWPGFSLSLIHI